MTIIYNIKFILLSIINEATYYFSNDSSAVSIREKYLILMSSKLEVSRKIRKILLNQYIDYNCVSKKEFLMNKYDYVMQYMLYILSLEEEELLQKIEEAKVMSK